MKSFLLFFIIVSQLQIAIVLKMILMDICGLAYIVSLVIIMKSGGGHYRKLRFTNKFIELS